MHLTFVTHIIFSIERNWNKKLFFFWVHKLGIDLKYANKNEQYKKTPGKLNKKKIEVNIHHV